MHVDIKNVLPEAKNSSKSPRWRFQGEFSLWSFHRAFNFPHIFIDMDLNFSSNEIVLTNISLHSFDFSSFPLTSPPNHAGSLRWSRARDASEINETTGLRDDFVEWVDPQARFKKWVILASCRLNPSRDLYSKFRAPMTLFDETVTETRLCEGGGHLSLPPCLWHAQNYIESIVRNSGGLKGHLHSKRSWIGGMNSKGGMIHSQGRWIQMREEEIRRAVEIATDKVQRMVEITTWVVAEKEIIARWDHCIRKLKKSEGDKWAPKRRNNVDANAGQKEP